MSTEDLNDFARDLSRLRPVRAAVDPYAVLYRAGFSAGRRSLARPLGGVALAAVVLAATFAVLWASDRRPPTAERVVFVHVAEPAQPAQPALPKHETTQPEITPAALSVGATTPIAPEQSVFAGRQQLEEHLLRWGLDGLPSPPAAPSGPRLTAEELLRSF